MDIGPDDCQIAAIPISHAYGLGNLVMPLLLQGTPIVLREAFIPQQLHADATTYGARVFHGVPFMFAHCANNPDAIAWPRVLETLVSAGAPLDPVMAVHVRSNLRREDPLVLRHERERRHLLRRLPGYRSRRHCRPAVARGDRHAAPRRPARRREGAPIDGGRVHVAGDAVSSGYAGQAPADEGFTDGGFLTGDFGRFDARQRLILTGRASSFINVAGKKIQPEEVEQVLRSMRGVEDVRVLGSRRRRARPTGGGVRGRPWRRC